MQIFCGDWPPYENIRETPDLEGTMGSRASTTRTSEVGGRVVLRERHPRTSCRNGQEVELDERCPLRTQFPRAVGLPRTQTKGAHVRYQPPQVRLGWARPKQFPGSVAILQGALVRAHGRRLLCRARGGRPRHGPRYDPEAQHHTAARMGREEDGRST